MAITIDQINAVTDKYFRKQIPQQVYEQTIILNRLRKQHRVIAQGGTKIQFPIRYKKLGDAAMIDPNDSRVTVHYETRTAGELDWKYAKVDLVMLWDEKIKNRGDAEIIDLMRDKILEGTQDLSEIISTQFHQTYASKGSKDMDGFFTAVRDPSSSTSYAGISSADAPAWVAGLYDTSTTTFALYGTGSLEAGYRACWFIDPPDLIVTTKALAGIYSSKLQTGERRRPEEGRAGATDLWFLGVPYLVDPQANSNTLMFLHTGSMYFVIQSGEDFAQEPWENDPDRYKAIRKLITVVGNFIFDTRKHFGAYTAITS